MPLLLVQVFIVDEPFLGLDPLGDFGLDWALAEEKANGKAILMSTHVLDSAEKMCERFVILHHGQVLAQGTLEELRETFATVVPVLTIFTCS